MESGNNRRKRYSAEYKFKVVKEVLTTDLNVSEACRRYGVSTAMYYRWQEQFLQAAQSGFNHEKIKPAEDRKAILLEAEVAKLREVITELTVENITLKKRQ